MKPKLALFTVVAISAMHVYAMETVGDLLKAGGKQATKEEATAALAKHGYSIKVNGYPVQFSTVAGGRIEGKAHAGNHGEFPASGTFKVADNGEFCYSAQLDISSVPNASLLYPNSKYPLSYCTNTFIGKDGNPYHAKNTSESSDLLNYVPSVEQTRQ